MSNLFNIMSDTSPQEKTKSDILTILPDLPDITAECSPVVQQKIDLMLLALEALTIRGTDKILELSQKLELQDVIKHRIFLWRLRCTNPWRRSYRRNCLKLEEAKALVMIIHYMAKSLEVVIRQRLTDAQLMKEKGLPVDNHFQLSQYLEKFKTHFASRMNSRRVKIMTYLSNEKQLNELALSLLSQLLFCTGTRGIERFWISLFDGEVK